MKPNSSKTPGGGSSNNILQALILHQHQQNLTKAQEELKVKQAEIDQIKKDHEALNKKRELDKKLHEETRKELEKYKSQYDANHILEQKTVKRETMKRARLAKKTVKKEVSKKAREAKKPASKGSSARARTRQSAKKRAQ